MVEVQNNGQELLNEVDRDLNSISANAVDLGNANSIAHEAHADSEVNKELKPMQECETKVINVLDKVTKVFEKESKLNNASKYRNQLQGRKQKLTANMNEMHKALHNYDYFANAEVKIDGKVARDKLKKNFANFQQYKADAEGIESQLPTIEERIDDELRQQGDLQGKDQIIAWQGEELRALQERDRKAREAEDPKNVEKLKKEMEDKKTDVEWIKNKLEEYQKKVKWKDPDLEAEINDSIKPLKDCLTEIDGLLNHLGWTRVYGVVIEDTKTKIKDFDGNIDSSKKLLRDLNRVTALNSSNSNLNQDADPYASQDVAANGGQTLNSGINKRNGGQGAGRWQLYARRHR